MSGFTRRSFLAAAGAAAGAVGASAVAGPAAAQRLLDDRTAMDPNRIPVVRIDRRVVLIGSGFGGGIASLRLTRAGVPVTILERGRRWRTGPNADTFPSATRPDKRALWHSSASNILGPVLGPAGKIDVEPYLGVVETCPGENMMPVCAATYGGGSLLYQGMSLQPKKNVFYRQFPSSLDYDELATVYYPRVSATLGLATAPDTLINTPNYKVVRIFADRVRRAGLPLSKIPMPIDWNYPLAEIAGKMKPSFTNGDGSLGVNNAGKNSVDKTYLHQAEQTGLLEVNVQHDVTSIERTGDGRYLVHVNRTDETGKTLETKIFRTKALILAAGSMGTSRLLVRARAHGTLTDLPDAVGTGWGTNADRIYSWAAPGEDFGPVQGGPVVYGSLNWDGDPDLAHTVIQASMPPLPGMNHVTTLVGYGNSNARGTFRYDAAIDDAVIQWAPEGDHHIQNKAIGPTVRKIVGNDGMLVDTTGMVPNTWHPLGGVPMVTACDLEGRMHGQSGLYVLDGALMPGNTAACNPSLTIAAVVERAMDRIIANDVGTLI